MGKERGVAGDWRAGGQHQLGLTCVHIPVELNLTKLSILAALWPK